MQTYPSSLYCYFSIESGLRFLETLKFRLLSVCAFNDPFESLFSTNYPHYFLSLTESCTDEEMEKRIKVLDEKHFWILTDTVRNKSVGRLNIVRNLKVGCFSEVGDNVLMWGHYARKFTGIAVKFRVSFGDWGSDLHQVEYHDKRLTVENFHEKELIGSNLEWQLVLRKSLHWAYEKEWRYIKAEKDCKTDEEGAYVSVDKNAIQEIFVGCRIQPDKLETLKSIVSDRFGDIPVKVALPSAYDYTLSFRRLSDVEYALRWK